ncbi:hypothetical protein OFN04_18440, partial [Escherichia coli]|nr:hypothetical protein [Escherichia coli]
DRNRSHWSTSKTPSYTKSVSWQHHLTTLIYLQIPVPEPIPGDPVPVPDPIPRPQPMPDPPPDEEPIKLSHRERRSARIRAC